MKVSLFILCILIIACCVQCSNSLPRRPAVEALDEYFKRKLVDTDSLITLFRKSVIENDSLAKQQQLFKESKISYKRTEFLIEYAIPHMATLINGAAVPEVETEDNLNTIIEPEGFQVIESILFSEHGTMSKATLLQEVDKLSASIRFVLSQSSNIILSDSLVFKSLRQEVFRIIALGVVGYDADLTRNAIPESRAAWQSVGEVLGLYKESLLKVDGRLVAQCDSIIAGGDRNLATGVSFNDFDRLTFITTYANPLSHSLIKLANALSVDMGNMHSPVKSSAENLFVPDAFDYNFYTDNESDHISSEKVLLGKKLFYDPILSGNRKRSCATCHLPAKGFTDGLAKSPSIDNRSVTKRNTLTLYNAGLQPALFYDMRVTFLEDQVTDVISSENEMHGSVGNALQKIKASASYIELFKKAFPESRETVTAYHFQNAIGSYIRSLVSLDAPFDRYMRGEKEQLSDSAIKGFNLFMGKAKCATCHFVPLFNGVLPPNFVKEDAEVLGVPEKPHGKIIDRDLGRYLVIPAAPNKFAFKTPTLRNVAITAPYMHNGAFKSLEEVLDFYNEGGGIGLGIHVPNQTLPARKLQLTTTEQRQIIAFLYALSDTAQK